MDRSYNPKQFVSFFNTATAKQFSTMFQSEFGPLRRVLRGGQCSQSTHEKYVTITASIIPTLYRYGGCHDYEALKGKSLW
jgi:hypothetical protein